MFVLFVYLHLEVEATGLVGVWPPAFSAILAFEFIEHKLERLTFGADPAASVSLEEKIRNVMNFRGKTFKNVVTDIATIFVKKVHIFCLLKVPQDLRRFLTYFCVVDQQSRKTFSSQKKYV